MNQFTRVQVIILPTKDNGTIDTYDSGKICLTKEKTDWSWKRGFKELYFISDDEIQEGDWYIHSGVTQEKEKYYNICHCYKGTRRLEKIDSRPDVLYVDGMFASDCKKIIVTTDTSLNHQCNENRSTMVQGYLTQPSQQFIEKYIESYNNDEIITDVLVEYEKVYNGYRHKDGEWQLKLKSILLQVQEKFIEHIYPQEAL